MIMGINNLLLYYSWLRKLSNRSGKSIFSLLIDYVSLKKKAIISRTEYENYTMYNKSEKFRDNFLSYTKASYYWALLNPVKYASLARNKYLSHCLLNELKIPTAELYIYYNRELSYISDNLANDFESVKKILLKRGLKSFVVKPAEDSAHGQGVFICRDLLITKDDCILIKQSGKEISLKSILKNVPLLFEEPVIQSSQLMSFNKSSVNTIRIMTALYPYGKTKTIASFIKIGRKGSEVDNAGNGGNIDCGINLTTGELYNPIQFNSWIDIKSIHCHPDTNAQLDGIIINDWQKIQKQVESFQARIPQLKTIGWDVAITDNGICIIEINNWWDTTGQLFIDKGWKNEVEECYNAWKKYYGK